MNPFRKLFPADANTYVGFFIFAAFCIGYSLKTGVLFIWPDSLAFTEQGHALFSSTMPEPPFYGWLLRLIPFLGDTAVSHSVLIAGQAFALACAFFPLRALLLNKTELRAAQAAGLAAATLLSPLFLIHTAMVTPYTFFSGALIYFVYFFDEALQNPNSRLSALCAGLLLGIQLLLLPLGLVVWMAAILTVATSIILNTSSRRKPRSQEVLLLASLVLIPSVFIAISGGQGMRPTFYGDSPLARFNYVKNGLLYMLFAGLPFAGLAVLIGAVLKAKEFWIHPTARFVFICLLAALFYAAFSTPVVVSHKLDYFTNRLLEPFLFLPVIVLFRLPAQSRKEIFYNGLLIFFVLAIFNLPYGLNLDFKSGMTFWSQALANPQLGFMKNIAFMVLLLGPAICLTWRPKALITVYICIGFVFALAGAYANQRWWQANEDSPLAKMDAQALAANASLAQASFVATDFSCDLRDNHDVAHLYRCLDAMKALYFIKKPIKLLSQLPTQKESYLFLPTQSDFRNGPLVGEAGLATVVEARPSTRPDEMAIDAFSGLQPYIFIKFPEGQQRVTAFAPQATLSINSKSGGCALLKARLAFDAKGGGSFNYKLNDAPAQKKQVPEIAFNALPQEAEMRLQLPQGESKLAFTYGEKANGLFPQENKLVLVGRPYFEICGKKQ